jgi:hypothetical protein
MGFGSLAGVSYLPEGNGTTQEVYERRKSGERENQNLVRLYRRRCKEPE